MHTLVNLILILTCPRVATAVRGIKTLNLNKKIPAEAVRAILAGLLLRNTAARPEDVQVLVIEVVDHILVVSQNRCLQVPSCSSLTLIQK